MITVQELENQISQLEKMLWDRIAEQEKKEKEPVAVRKDSLPIQRQFKIPLHVKFLLLFKQKHIHCFEGFVVTSKKLRGTTYILGSQTYSK